jgi:hypothetical protein
MKLLDFFGFEEFYGALHKGAMDFCGSRLHNAI